MKNQTIKTTSEVKNLSSQLYFFVHITLTCVWKQKKKRRENKRKLKPRDSSFHLISFSFPPFSWEPNAKKYIGQNSSKYIKRNKD